MRVLIVEDLRVAVAGLESLLSAAPGITLCGTVHSGLDVRGYIEALKPSLVITDLFLRHQSGIELIRAIKHQFDDIKVLVFSRHNIPLYAYLIRQAGADGYLPKSATPKQIAEAMQTIHEGQPYLPSLQAVVYEDPISSLLLERRLSLREIEIFQLIGEGLTQRDIAERLRFTLKTAESHALRIQSKLSLGGMRALIQMAGEWVIRYQRPMQDVKRKKVL